MKKRKMSLFVLYLVMIFTEHQVLGRGGGHYRQQLAGVQGGGSSSFRGFGAKCWDSLICVLELVPKRTFTPSPANRENCSPPPPPQTSDIVTKYAHTYHSVTQIICFQISSRISVIYQSDIVFVYTFISYYTHFYTCIKVSQLLCRYRTMSCRFASTYTACLAQCRAFPNQFSNFH